MTDRDERSIRSLYFIHRYIPSSIARLFGVSPKHILEVLHEETKSITVIADVECILCGLEDATTFYIDGDESNKKPQNIVMLCEADRRRLLHMQLRRRQGFVISQF